MESDVSASVRAAAREDADLLHTVAAETFSLACPPHTTPEAIDAFIAQHLSRVAFAGYLADPDRMLFVAERGGAAAGYAMVVLGEPADADAAAAITVRPTAELSKLYVRQRHHGAGVAAALMAAAVTAVASRGAAGIWLGVNQENARANRFYEKAGFALVGTKRFLVGEILETDYVRERTLDPRSAGD